MTNSRKSHPASVEFPPHWHLLTVVQEDSNSSAYDLLPEITPHATTVHAADTIRRSNDVMQVSHTRHSPVSRDAPTMQDLMSGIVVAGQRSSRGHGLSGARTNPKLFEREKLFERDDTDASATSSDSRFEREEGEACGAGSVRRTSVSNVGALTPNDNTAFVY